MRAGPEIKAGGKTDCRREKGLENFLKEIEKINFESGKK